MIKKLTISLLILFPGLNSLAQCGTFPQPAKPILDSATQTICENSPSPTFTVTNATGTVTWSFKNSTFSGQSFTPNLFGYDYHWSIVIIVSQTENGCESQNTTATLHIIPEPVIPSVSLDHTICGNNKPTSFYAQGMGSNCFIKWYKSQSDIGTSNYDTGSVFLPTVYKKPLSDGASDEVTTFYVTECTKDTNHCESPTNSIRLFVKSKPLPPTFIGNSTITTCANNSNVAPLSVNVTNGFSYVWFNKTSGLTITSTDGIVSGISNNSFKPKASILDTNSTIQYYVRQQSDVGCQSDSIVGTYNVTDCIVFDAFISSINISIFPNPTSQFIKITANSEMTGKGILKLFNISGVLVYEKSLTTVQTIVETISVNMLPNGIYTVVIETENGGKSVLVNVQH